LAADLVVHDDEKLLDAGLRLQVCFYRAHQGDEPFRALVSRTSDPARLASRSDGSCFVCPCILALYCMSDVRMVGGGGGALDWFHGVRSENIFFYL
jgi:hypothetical protein